MKYRFNFIKFLEMLAQDKMVASNRPQSTGDSSSTDDFLNNDSSLQCSYCNFRCDVATTMSQHSWEQHPLFMRRKKHLIPSQRMNANASLSSDETATQSLTVGTPPPVKQTAEEMQNCKLTSCNVNKELGVSTPVYPEAQRNQQEAITYRNNAIRSLSLLSTAAAIVEGQANASPQRHVAVVKPRPMETPLASGSFPLFETQGVRVPMYSAYIPSLNQYVTIPISPANVVPHPAILNNGLDNAVNVYFNAQQSLNTQFPSPMAQPRPYFTHKTVTAPTQSLHGVQKPIRPATDEIRSLLQSTKSQVRQTSLSTPVIQQLPIKVNKTETLEHLQTSSASFPQPILDKERIQALEKAILSTDCCDINDSSTTMPFKCADGIWRMVKFKCIKGLWVVQTPDSSTPTVYVPCDDENFPGGEETTPPARKAVRSLSETSGRKRRLSDGTGSEGDAKRLCSSAPVLSDKGEKVLGKEAILHRTLSNPFVTKALPPPSQHFTNNEGKRVNISMIKRNCSQTSSCSLIKSLLLRKPAHLRSVSASSQTSGAASPSFPSSSSNSSNELECKPASDVQLGATIALAKPLLKSAMAY